MEIEFVRKFIESIGTIIDSINGQVHLGQIEITENRHLLYDISAIIGMAKRIKGFTVINYPFLTAQNLVSCYYGCGIESEQYTLQNGIGEISEKVILGLKSEFNSKNLFICLLGVNTNKNQIKSLPIPRIVVPFKSTFGEFTVELYIKNVAVDSIIEQLQFV